MKIVGFETLVANAGLRNYVFLRLRTDTGVTGIGEATLEWQEETVRTLLHEWVEGRTLGRDPFDVERVVGDMIRDQYQGGATVMTAISAVEIAMWDIIGKCCGQPIYRLLGGRYHARLPAYANGWYGGARIPEEFADHAAHAVGLGYTGLKFDPFGVASGELTAEQLDEAVSIVAAVRERVGTGVRLMVEYHGRLATRSAKEAIAALDRYAPFWSEEPVAPEKLELLAEVRRDTGATVAAGERLYTIPDFARLIALRCVDVVQFDVAHCGGILASKKIAAIAAVADVAVAPHCSIGPVALAAALHTVVGTPNFLVQEAFAEFDVPWRNDLVHGWNPIANGSFHVTDAPGLGLELDDDAIADHPYVKHAFPSLWDSTWMKGFRQDGTS